MKTCSAFERILPSLFSAASFCAIVAPGSAATLGGPLTLEDEGSFFVPHRDTEKAPGMFATLVLALPSVSEGGELIIRHKDREARLELTCEEPSDVAFAARMADSEGLREAVEAWLVAEASRPEHPEVGAEGDCRRRRPGLGDGQRFFDWNRPVSRPVCGSCSRA